MQDLASRLVMSARKRPAAATLAASPKKRLRGKQEAPSYNEGLPAEFLAWRAQHIYTVYKNIGGARAMKDLAGNLALAEPNPIHYAEYMGIYMDSCLAAEGQPPVACLSLLVEEWGVELTVAEWKEAARKQAAKKRPAGKPAKSLFCKGFDGSPCRFSAKEAGRPSRGALGSQQCSLCSEALLKQCHATPAGRGNLARVLKALRAHKSDLDTFEVACSRAALWLGAEAADELRAKAAAPKRPRPRRTRAAAREEQLSAAKASFGLATSKRQSAGPAPSQAAWHAYRAKAVAEQRRGKKKFYPDAQRRARTAQAEIADAKVDNSPDLPAASWSVESIALQKWSLRGAWGMCPDCNILQARPLTFASFGREEHTAAIRPSECKTCKRNLRKHYVPQVDDVPQPLQGLSEAAVAALRLLDYDLGPESRADNGYRKHVRMIRFSWAIKTPKQKIAELFERAERRKARAALQHLLNDEANAYGKFHADHKEFLNLHGGTPSETAAKRPLHFVEELGLECATWPTLYWKTSMCETHERYTDHRRLEREHDEAELEDVEGADGQRHSIKRSFRAKLLGPLLGYGSNFALLQFVYDLQLWTELGAKRNMAERQNNKMRLMMAQHPMSPLYWRAVLAGLQDLVRQIGAPQLYWTFAPWELSFPYSDFLLDELRKQLRARFGAPAHETLHITHCMLEAVRGLMAGGAGAPGNQAKWSRFLLQGSGAEDKTAGCFHFFTRLEFQDGSKKVGTQRYHGSGRPHLHVLFWLERPECVDWQRRALAQLPDANISPSLAAFAQGSQQDRAGESRWPVWTEPSGWNAAADHLQLQHSAEAADAGFRAFFPDLMDCFRCHQDLQASDGRQLLLTYVAKYVAKWSDSSFQEWMSDSAAANSVARKVLFEYHPLEPEMVLQLCGNFRQWDMGTLSGGKRDLVAPKLGAEPSRQLQQYLDSSWRGEGLNFLDFLRKTTQDGDIAPWVKQAHKALPEGHPDKATTLSYLWRLNDAFYGQWLLMNVPFRNLQEFNFPEIKEHVPERYHSFATALLATDRRANLPENLRNFWRSPAAMAQDMLADGISEKIRGDFLHFAAAHAEAVDAYLARRVDLADEVVGEVEALAGAPAIGHFVFHGHQALLAQQIEERVATATKARTAASEAAGQGAREDAGKPAHRPIVCLGEPGTGKSTVLRAQVERVLGQGGQVLCALPTAQFAARSRAKLPEHENLAVDTHTAAFQLHLPEQETIHALHGLDLIVVDEVQQLGAEDFERILRLWRHAERVPALIFLGDKYQLPGVAPARPWESPAWQRLNVHFTKLTEVHRCKDPSFLEKLRALRTSQPSQQLLHDLCRGHKAWRGEEPSLADLRLHLSRFPNTTMVTCTKKKAAQLNELVLQLRHPRKKPWTTLPGDVDVNPNNYDRLPQPSEVPIYKGVQLYLTKNVRKKDDYVNGMLCHVEAWSATSGALRVRTKTGKRLYVTPWTDVERGNVAYYPIRLGYASTVQKILGDEVEHITVWLDTPNLPAVAYTALSRVERSSAYSLAGKLTPAHFAPAVEK